MIMRCLMAVGLCLVLLASGCGEGGEEALVPQLLTPAEGQVMDNGRSDCYEPISWHFTWTEVPGAQRYQLTVENLEEGFPFIEVETLYPDFEWCGEGHIPQESLTGWKWRVRAGTMAEWWEWSEERSFSVEPPELDDPQGGG